MIRLKPILEILPQSCPECGSVLTAGDFLIPGMRNLADLNCQNCKSEFFGDLPAGQGLYTPILLNKKSGAVYDDYNVGWFSDWLADSYAKRKKDLLGFKIRKLAEVKNKVVLLNCLDTLYGHSLLKLLNAQYYIDFQTDFSLIVMIPPFLEWMMPEGIAEVWIVDLPLRRGIEWNDWLAGEIAGRLKPYREVYLSTAFSHPHPEDYNIGRFTRIAPFLIEEFGENSDKPVITFIWREDRLWETPNAQATGLLGKFKRKPSDAQTQINEQARKVISFAETLRSEFPLTDFAVAGIGRQGTLPDWIQDLKFTDVNTETEGVWCKRYARSHIVVGVHGSNMLLPSAHAGSIIELIGDERQGNYLQDVLFRSRDVRESMFLYRFVPLSTTPESLSHLASIMIRYEDFRKLMSPEFCRHGKNYDLTRWLSRKAPKRPN